LHRSTERPKLLDVARGGRACLSLVLVVGCALGAWFAASATIALAQSDPEVRRLKPGVFLYASPSLRDSNFAETVVLLVEYGPNGAMGLVINRATDSRAADALKDAGALRKLVVHWGGPVQPDAVFGLVGAARKPKGGVRVLDGVFLTGKRKHLEAAVQQDETGERVRVYAGYSGWGAGQLESEVLRNGWIVAPGDADAVFSRRPDEVWDDVHRLLDRLEARTSPGRGPWQHGAL
jgi:putative transcriptional regulator